MSNLLAIADATAAIPEIFLAISGMALLMLGVFSSRNNTDTINSLALAALAVTAGLVLYTSSGEVERGFHDSFIVDGFARFMKILTLFGSAIALILSSSFLKTERLNKFEYPVLILLATLGMLVMISANDLIALYMGLELQALVALRGGCVQPRQRTFIRGRPEVLRAGRAVLGHAAVRCITGLRVLWLGSLCRHRQGRCGETR
jgi:RsiW-degrading membrane proteinase PrsW (M82 family)